MSSSSSRKPDPRRAIFGGTGLVALVLAIACLLGAGTVGAQPPESGGDPVAVSSLAERLEPVLDDAYARLRLLVSYLPLLGIGLVVVAIFFFLSRLVGRASGFFERITPNRFASELLRQASVTAVILVGVLIALEILDATALVGAVLGTAGVVGLAIGFAFRDLVENYIASILLSIRQPFAPNDSVVINDHTGSVVRLTSRATILMTPDGNHLRIPNAQVFKGIILNYTRNPRRRFDFGVGVGVNEDLRAAQRLGLDALEEMPGVVADPPPSALIEALGDSNVLIRFYGWVDQREASFGKVKSEAIRQVKTVLEQAGMDLPEPIYRLQIKGRTDLAPADDESPERRPEAASPTSAEDIRPDDPLENQIEMDRALDDTGQDLLDRDASSE